MFENWQKINPMGLSASMINYKNKKYLTNINISPTILIWNTKSCKGFYQMVICAPWAESYFHNWIY